MAPKGSHDESPNQRLTLGLTLAPKGNPNESPKQRFKLGLTLAPRGSPFVWVLIQCETCRICFRTQTCYGPAEDTRGSTRTV